MNELDDFHKAVSDLKRELGKAFEPIILPIVKWIDRQLRRSPRLYDWLSR